jgi:hypothetical protein
VKEGGFFGKTFVLYIIETTPNGWKVPRRYSQFLWLREQLLKNYVAFYVF